MIMLPSKQCSGIRDAQNRSVLLPSYGPEERFRVVFPAAEQSACDHRTG